ncbi:hypothetical protein [Intestinibacillus massiliensis]|uniref:hypothetical protein n=1 Tax=Intestinibacillus massiliensis TaxID=1871029 RepID=UPI00117992CD|nr:hypothetical protein [Intestinibacillus massiliensis]
MPITGQIHLVYDAEGNAFFPQTVDGAVTVGDTTLAAKAQGWDAEKPAREAADAALGERVDGASKILFKDFYTGQGIARNPAPALSEARKQSAAVTIGNHALFAGGRNSGALDVVDVFNDKLQRTTKTQLSQPLYGSAAATVGEYTIIGGGVPSDETAVSVVNAFNSSLVRSIPTGLSVSKRQLAATTVGGFVLFGGGSSATNATFFDTIDVYNANLTHTNPVLLSHGRNRLAATTAGDYALFGGGSGNTSGHPEYNFVDAYNASLVRTLPAPTSPNSYGFPAATAGSNAIFLTTNWVDVYTSTLVHSVLSIKRMVGEGAAATSIADCAVFAGGGPNAPGQDTVQAIDSNLRSVYAIPLSSSRAYPAATAIGVYAIFAGGSGETNTETVDTVDALNYDVFTNFTIPGFTKYKFDGFHAEEKLAIDAQEWYSPGRITGYICTGGFTLTGL